MIRHVAGFRRVVANLEIHLVGRRDALLEREHQLALLGLAIWLLAVEVFIQSIKRITESLDRAKDRSRLAPVAVATVLREGTHPHGPRAEVLQVLLLGEPLREIASARRCEQVGHEQLALAGRFHS